MQGKWYGDVITLKQRTVSGRLRSSCWSQQVLGGLASVLFERSCDRRPGTMQLPSASELASSVSRSPTCHL